ncbi:hypothetical protein A5320_17570 [Rheinheimera sp. SA_1]|uniref:tetratricopeptide repeat protein n=1 Tax=Rheinheimera sp. SA_1 TaxID=1827365 RepID=UPI000801F61C|nr:tetratricopeptide repeat protein [Rheinheimera sp. SA_1]OBP13728.1 hypothetical protein A5320_17570 [Rheinheimera sp. SA_1]
MNFCNNIKMIALLPAMLLSWHSTLLYAAPPPTAELYQRSAAMLAQNPAQVISNFEQSNSALPQAPPWYQRDWYLLAARAYTARNLFPQARDSLSRADALVPTGIAAGEIALTAGFVTYQQQFRQGARFWFNCADKFPNPPESRAKLLLNLGIVEAFAGDYQSAMTHYQHGLALAEQHKFTTLIPMYLNSIGNLHWRLAQYEPAITALRQATFQYARLNNKVSQSRAGVNLLNVLVTMDDWERYQRLYPGIEQAVVESNNNEFRLMLNIFEAVRQRAVREPLSLSDAELIKLMSELKNINLQGTTQLLAHKIKLGWQAPKVPVEPPEQQLRLPNTEALCNG